MTENGMKFSNRSFWELPAELIDQILPEIELHHDLVNFACASRLCSQLVVPRHTEYRVIHSESSRCTPIWSHLARRPNLARNICEISILSRGFSGYYLHEPSSLMEDVDRKERSAQAGLEDVLRALSHMPRLKKFSWDQYNRWPATDCDRFVPLVCGILAQIGSIEHLSWKIIDAFKFHQLTDDCALWRMQDLRSLILGGMNDLLLPEHMPLVNWLSSLTSLELLSLPVNTLERHHTKLFFPNLRSFKISTWQNDISSIILKFLHIHSTLEEVSWETSFHIPSIPSGSDFLPNLRYLYCQYAFFRALISQTHADLNPPRKFDSLVLSYFDRPTFLTEFCQLPGIDRDSLLSLFLSKHHSIRDARQLAAAFPMIEELFLPRFDLVWGNVFHFEQFLSGIEQFKHLRVLHHGVVWSDLNQKLGEAKLQQAVDERIQILAERCPNLIEIGHHRVHGSRYIVKRDNVTGMISTRVETDSPRSEFEIRGDIGFWW